MQKASIYSNHFKILVLLCIHRAKEQDPQGCALYAPCFKQTLSTLKAHTGETYQRQERSSSGQGKGAAIAAKPSDSRTHVGLSRVSTGHCSPDLHGIYSHTIKT